MPTPSDLVHETSSTTGTGNFTTSNVNGKRSFNTAFGTGGTDLFDYYIQNRDAAEWERGTGHLSAATTLVRDTVIDSSNSAAAVNFSAGTKDLTNDVPALSQAWGSGSILPGGRLTLTSVTPVLIADVATATTVYYAFYLHDKLPIFDGKLWRIVTFTELSLALDSNSGHTGYQQSGKLFDFFYAYVAGTLYFGTGPAWTNDTTRADALGRKNGIWTNNASMTLRHGSASGNTVTVPANQGLYLGTMRATADGSTDFVFGGAASNGTAAKFGLWNMYNRITFASLSSDTTTSWTLASSSTRSANNSTTMRTSFVCGLKEDKVEASYNCESASGTSGVVAVGIGVDSTSAFSGTTGSDNNSLATAATRGEYAGVFLGWHFLQAMEAATVAGTATFVSGSLASRANGLIVRLPM